MSKLESIAHLRLTTSFAYAYIAQHQMWVQASHHNKDNETLPGYDAIMEDVIAGA